MTFILVQLSAIGFKGLPARMMYGFACRKVETDKSISNINLIIVIL